MLGDDVAFALPDMRAEAESLMCDTIRLEHQTGTDLDTDTLAVTPTYATDYEGPGRVQRPNVQPGEPVAGGVEFGSTAAVIQLPLSVTVAAKGQRATVVAAADPAMVGATFTVIGVQTKTHATMRRLFCEELT